MNFSLCELWDYRSHLDRGIKVRMGESEKSCSQNPFVETIPLRVNAAFPINKMIERYAAEGSLK